MIEAFSPAKLNLFLHVVGRRADGYHRLESLMVLIDFGDRMRFHARPDGEIVRSGGNAVVAVADDLAVRAARLLQQRTGCRAGVEIQIDKSIPLGGGMGGGSSNAATTLLALNRLWRLNLDRRSLCKIGVELGADVPFFVFGESAFATGIGEQLVAMSVPPTWFVVIRPPVAVPTARVFASAKLTRHSESARIPAFPEGFGRNDLQPVAVEQFPKLEQCLTALTKLAPARMTGSGACSFAAFPTERQAWDAMGGVPARCHGIVARLLPRHPLWAFAGSQRQASRATG